MKCNELNLWFGQVVNTQTSPIIVQHTNDEVSKLDPIDSTRTTRDESIQIPMKQQTPSQMIFTRGCQTGMPYPGRLSLSKPNPCLEFDFSVEL